MNGVVIGVIALVILFLLMGTRMWVGLAMALVGFLGLLVLKTPTQAISIVGSQCFVQLNNYNLTAIPMFLLMGMIIAETSIGSGLYSTASAWIGHFRGGLASATAVASGLLGAICSASNTGAIIMSKIAYPEMKKRDYDGGFSVGSIAAGAPLSIIIPPSMSFIMYGTIAEQSIGKLFMSGFVPGFILMVCYVIAVSITMRLKPEWGPAGPKRTWRQRLKSVWDILPMVVLFVIVFGGIYGGIFTTTESGAIGAVGAVIIAVLTRQITWKKLAGCIVSTAMISSTILTLMGGTYIFSAFLTQSGLPQAMAALVTSVNLSRIALLLMIMVVYIIFGMFMPDNLIVILTVPILFPIIQAMGIDPIWFGTFVVFMVAFGQISPPVGMVVYYASALTGESVSKSFAGVMPFLVAMIIVILLIIFFPSICTWLPNTMA